MTVVTANTSQINDVPPSPTQKVAWYDVIGQWRQAVQDFDTNLAALESQSGTLAAVQSSDPTLYAQYQSLMATVPTVQNRIHELDGAIADVENWLKGAWNAVTGAWDFVKTKVTSLFGIPDWTPPRSQAMAGLGQWQLVPIAVVAAGVAYVGAKAMALYQMHTKLAAVQSYIAKGYTPAAAAAIVAKTTGSSSIFGNISTSIKWAAVAIGAGAILLFLVKRK